MVRRMMPQLRSACVSVAGRRRGVGATGSSRLADSRVGAEGHGTEGFFGERVAALEFAVGTARIALPLAEQGVRVAGLDNSEEMLGILRQKPGAERVEAMAGDMSATRVDGEFSLVYLVFNTIFNLNTQDGQVACFANAAAHLERGGRYAWPAELDLMARLAGMRLEGRYGG